MKKKKTAILSDHLPGNRCPWACAHEYEEVSEILQSQKQDKNKIDTFYWQRHHSDTLEINCQLNGNLPVYRNVTLNASFY